jgi:dienelactone hydrolase
MEIKHGLNTYVSKPSSGDGSNKIIFLPDIFGIYPNAKLLADEWAGQGYEVYLPDLFDGSPIDHELLNVGRAAKGAR